MQATMYGDLMYALAVVLYNFLEVFPNSQIFVKMGINYIYRWL